MIFCDPNNFLPVKKSPAPLTFFARRLLSALTLKQSRPSAAPNDRWKRPKADFASAGSSAWTGCPMTTAWTRRRIMTHGRKEASKQARKEGRKEGRGSLALMIWGDWGQLTEEGEEEEEEGEEEGEETRR